MFSKSLLELPHKNEKSNCSLADYHEVMEGLRLKIHGTGQSQVCIFIPTANTQGGCSVSESVLVHVLLTG